MLPKESSHSGHESAKKIKTRLWAVEVRHSWQMWSRDLAIRRCPYTVSLKRVAGTAAGLVAWLQEPTCSQNS